MNGLFVFCFAEPAMQNPATSFANPYVVLVQR